MITTGRIDWSVWQIDNAEQLGDSMQHSRLREDISLNLGGFDEVGVKWK